MVSTNKVQYHGLTLLVRPFPAKPESVGADRYLFLTGESSDFEVRTKNTTGMQIEGKIAIQFAYGGISSGAITNHYIKKIKIEPYGESISYLHESHQFEGQVVVTVCNIGSPEQNLGVDDNQMRDLAKLESGEVLCTYKVLDKVIYELETQRFADLAKNLKESLTTHIDITIQARLAELGLTGNNNLKTDVIKEKAKLLPAEQKPEYIR
jgi:hypothetical protein